MGKIDLSKSDHSGDFNYKQGFYLTDSWIQAAIFVDLFVKCPDGYAVVQYHWDPKNLRVLHLNNTEEAKEFCWDSEIIHDKLQSNPPGHLTPEEEKIKQEFDSHDMIWGGLNDEEFPFAHITTKEKFDVKVNSIRDRSVQLKQENKLDLYKNSSWTMSWNQFVIATEKGVGGLSAPAIFETFTPHSRWNTVHTPQSHR